MNTAQTGEQHQPDAVGAGNAGDRFQFATDHRLDHDMSHIRVAANARGDGGGIAQPDMHQTEIALMRDAIRDALQHDRDNRSDPPQLSSARDAEQTDRWRPSARRSSRNSARLSGSDNCRAGSAGAGRAADLRQRATGGGVNIAPIPSSTMSISVNTSMPMVS